MFEPGPVSRSPAPRQRLLVGTVIAIWLVAGGLAAWLLLISAGQSTAETPDLAVPTRIDPADLLADPSLLFTEPGVLGLAVQLEAERLVGECMQSAGFAYDGVPGIERLSGFDQLAATSYGVGQSLTLESELADLAYLEQLSREALDDYEAALYGEPLRQLAAGALPGGCARAGLESVVGALAELEALRPSLDELFAAGADDDRWQAAGDRWVGCMAEQVGAVGSLFEGAGSLLPFAPEFGDPDTFMAFFMETLGSPVGRTLEAISPVLAEADAACRAAVTAGPVEGLVGELARTFTAANEDRLLRLLEPAGG